jgi:hypothetical protein
MSVFSLVRGRPGDVEAGLFGGLIGGILRLFILAVELIGRRIADQKAKEHDVEA